MLLEYTYICIRGKLDTMIDYTVKLVSLSGRVKGFSTKGVDGDYVIFINQNLSYEQQRKAFEHELEHIRNGDLDSYERSVAIVENKAHRAWLIKKGE